MYRKNFIVNPGLVGLVKSTYLILSFSMLLLYVAPIALAEFDNVSLTSPKLVTITGQELTTFHVGQQIGVESNLTNHAASEQKFTYIVQVANKDGGIEYLEGFSASMVSNQTFTASQVWIPKESGDYTIQVFVWDRLASAIPLTNVLQTQITVIP